MKKTMSALLLLTLSVGAVETRIPIGEFSHGKLTAWAEKSFQGHSEYRLVEKQGRKVLHAHSRDSASGLYREVAIDLSQTPLLNWSWKTEQLLQNNDERRREGDDYPLRVYVVFSGGLRFWRTRAINYVWSSHQAVGSQWPNAFTSNAIMIAVNGGEEGLGEWQQLQRDVLADYRQLFGNEPGRVDAVAIMTDTDNTGQEANAWYGDIWFSAR